MERGWDASGLLQPLWQHYPGKRDALAAKVGTSPSVLSQVNTGGRRLGVSLGGRLAAELGVSLAELGAPEAAAVDQSSLTMRDRLEELAADLAEAVREITSLRERVATLEGRSSPAATQPTRRRQQTP